jgi:hypothetical protein
MLALLAGLLLSCGTERWAVKTLADADARRVEVLPLRMSIADLAAEEAPEWDDNRPREGIELFTVEVQANLTGYKLEADGDFHLVLEDGDKTMIAEIPSPACAKGSFAAQRMAKARHDFIRLIRGNPLPKPRFTKLKKPIAVEIIGIAFFDKLHGQAGGAPNGIELHPVLSLEAMR